MDHICKSCGIVKTTIEKEGKFFCGYCGLRITSNNQKSDLVELNNTNNIKDFEQIITEAIRKQESKIRNSSSGNRISIINIPITVASEVRQSFDLDIHTKIFLAIEQESLTESLIEGATFGIGKLFSKKASDMVSSNFGVKKDFLAFTDNGIFVSTDDEPMFLDWESIKSSDHKEDCLIIYHNDGSHSTIRYSCFLDSINIGIALSAVIQEISKQIEDPFNAPYNEIVEEFQKENWDKVLELSDSFITEFATLYTSNLLMRLCHLKGLLKFHQGVLGKY
ncbi:MAG: hypothetical protein IPL26_10490 [Leptospiraceae bacterium]|nr:hypothetical protein [Leptospiraceae bacterium]